LRDPLMRVFALLLTALLFAAPAQAAMSGRFVERDAGGEAKLRITVDKDGHVSGELRFADGRAYALNGEQLENSAQGALKAGASGKARDAFFYAEQGAGGVMLQFIPRGTSGKPELANAQSFAFVAEGAPRESDADKAIRMPELRESADAEMDAQLRRLPQAHPRR